MLFKNVFPPFLRLLSFLNFFKLVSSITPNYTNSSKIYNVKPNTLNVNKFHNNPTPTIELLKKFNISIKIDYSHIKRLQYIQVINKIPILTMLRWKMVLSFAIYKYNMTCDSAFVEIGRASCRERVFNWV